MREIFRPGTILRNLKLNHYRKSIALENPVRLGYGLQAPKRLKLWIGGFGFWSVSCFSSPSSSRPAASTLFSSEWAPFSWASWQVSRSPDRRGFNTSCFPSFRLSRFGYFEKG